MSRLLDYLQNLDPRQRLAVAVVTPALLLFVYHAFLLGPRMTRTEELEANIKSMREERDRKIVETAQMENREHEVQELDRQLKLALTRLPDEKEIPDLLSAVSNLGRDSGLDILVFRQKDEGYQEFYAEVPVEMQVRGTYHQVATFFDRVGRLERIVNVSNIVLRDPKLADDDLLLEANSTVTTFRFLSDVERERLIEQKKIKGDVR